MIWIKIFIKRQCKRLLVIVGTAFSIFGIIVTIGEVIEKIFNYKEVYQLYRENIILIALFALTIAIILKRDDLSYSVRIANSPDVSITLRVCNALNNKGAVIIPTNSTFDTSMLDDFISEKSLQGQYQKRYFKKNLYELNKLIKIGLENSKGINLYDGRKTNTKRYPIGTLCKISGENVKKRAYFLADSDININGIPENVDMMDIMKSLVSLWEGLGIIGNKEDYSIPLLGTGRAGVKNASRDEIVKNIVNTFLMAIRECKITENLIICIHPLDFEKIHWDDLCEYIKYQCTFTYVHDNSEQVGVQEKSPERIALAPIDYDFDFEELTEVNDKGDSSVVKQSKKGDFEDCIEKTFKTYKEREEKIIEILSGNQLTASEIAVATGMSMNSTRAIIKKLMERGQVQTFGVKNRKYTVVSNQNESCDKND